MHVTRETVMQLQYFEQYLFRENICIINILKKDSYCDIQLSESNSATHIPEVNVFGKLATSTRRRILSHSY